MTDQLDDEIYGLMLKYMEYLSDLRDRTPHKWLKTEIAELLGEDVEGPSDT